MFAEFAQFHPARADIPLGRDRRPKCFAFLYFSSRDDYQRCLDTVDKLTTKDGRTLTVRAYKRNTRLPDGDRAVPSTTRPTLSQRTEWRDRRGGGDTEVGRSTLRRDNEDRRVIGGGGREWERDRDHGRDRDRDHQDRERDRDAGRYQEKGRESYNRRSININRDRRISHSRQYDERDANGRGGRSEVQGWQHRDHLGDHRDRNRIRDAAANPSNRHSGGRDVRGPPNRAWDRDRELERRWDDRQHHLPSPRRDRE